LAYIQKKKKEADVNWRSFRFLMSFNSVSELERRFTVIVNNCGLS